MIALLFLKSGWYVLSYSKLICCNTMLLVGYQSNKQCQNCNKHTQDLNTQ